MESTGLGRTPKPEISTGPTNNYQWESVMETWYRTGRYAYNIIEPVVVVKSTAKTVTVKEADWNGRERESRSAIQSVYYQYFRTWDEAYAQALSSAEMEVNLARRALEKANGHLGNVRGLKKPA